MKRTFIQQSDKRILLLFYDVMFPSMIVVIFLATMSGFSVCHISSHPRSERSVLFPYSGITQVTFGFNLPWDAPPLRTIGTNLAYQIQYLLPDNASELNDLYVSGRDRSRRDLYSHLEGLMEDYQLSGRDCLLKVICELARVPFHRDEPWTLMEEILHIILTPSEDQDEEGCVNEVKYDTDHRDLCTDKDVFLSAEDLGLSGGDCDAAYPSCPTSPLELVTENVKS